ncbi:MAG: hypothetical protein ABSF18_06055 [Gammaproteobacteria bacterium]|jgi:hypothetical protein
MKLQRIAENYYLSLPIAVGLALLPLVNWIGLVWATFATLRQNTYLGILAVGLVGFVNFYLFNNMEFSGLAGEWIGLFAFIAPLWAMAYGLRVLRSLNLSLQIGFFILAICALINYGIYGTVTYDELYQYIFQRVFNGETPTTALAQTIQSVYIEAMVTTTILAWPMMLFLLQVMLLFIARYFQSRWYNPGGFKVEFQGLRLSPYMAVFLVLSFVWAMLAPQNQVSIQIAGLVAMLYSIAGIAFLHWYMNVKQLDTWWFVLFYVLLFVLSAWALPLLALVALADSHLDLRTRTKR